jgi:hypothetical protein
VCWDGSLPSSRCTYGSTGHVVGAQ